MAEELMHVSSAKSHTHNSSMLSAYKMRARVGSPNALKMSANRPNVSSPGIFPRTRSNFSGCNPHTSHTS